MDKTLSDKILSDCNVLVRDTHVVYASGKHGDTYFNKNEIFARPEFVALIAEKIAEKFQGQNIEVVIGPVTGGSVLSSWVAYYLGRLENREVWSLYADKNGDNFEIKRGYDKYLSGKNILVVEDVLTTGGSVKKVIEAVTTVGGNVVGLAAICNRGGLSTEDFGNITLFSLLNLNLNSWEPNECPLCKKGTPINKELGHG